MYTEMKGLYIVVGNNGTIYGAYDSDEAAQECLKHVSVSHEDLSPKVRHIILNKNYWDIPDSQKYNELYDIK